MGCVQLPPSIESCHKTLADHDSSIILRVSFGLGGRRCGLREAFHFGPINVSFPCGCECGVS